VTDEGKVTVEEQLRVAQAIGLRRLSDLLHFRNSGAAQRIRERCGDGFYISGHHKGQTVTERCARLLRHWADTLEQHP
jgi:hypothetical protein